MGASRGDFTKYPRTPHLFGSRGTDDDKHLGQQESLDFISDSSLIVEEKLDGTNVGIHFTSAGRMVLQCRGHEITAGMHVQYDLFKQWTMCKRPVLEAMLEDRLLPVVSLDDLRAQLEVDAADNQGAVIQAAREACREHLRSGRDFAFNGTNTVRHTHKRWIDLFADYGARVEMVYVEPPLSVIFHQNQRRPNQSRSR
jgi:hypothetical protein